MTVIAWDGRALAADKQNTIGGTPVPVTKVFKVKAPDGRRFLVAAAGEEVDCVTFLRWFKAAGEGMEKPRPTSLRVICIDEQHRMWLLDEKMVWFEHAAKIWALGCGADYALGAMAMGATARRAVLIASKFDVNCGLGVDVVRFR